MCRRYNAEGKTLVGSDWKGGRSVEGCSAPMGCEPVVPVMEADLGTMAIV
jgi:hypothetical protein